MLNTTSIKYKMTLGMSAMDGRGFYYPTDLAIGENGRFYVTNRSIEGVDRGVRVTMCDIDSNYYGIFGYHGEKPGQFIHMSSIAVDNEQNLYITDEYMNRISKFDKEGNYIENWGETGSREGLLDCPSGIAIDSEQQVYISDTENNRIQIFDKNGTFISSFGHGSLKLPWGLTINNNGDIYVADWGNHRIVQFSKSGDILNSFGSFGSKDGELKNPAGVAVGPDGTLYIADWGNERVQVFDSNGNFVDKTRGQATLSKWAENFLSINTEEADARSRSNLEPEIEFFNDDPHEESSHIEKLFWSPLSIKLDAEGLLYIVDGNRHRIQIYQT